MLAPRAHTKVGLFGPNKTCIVPWAHKLAPRAHNAYLTNQMNTLMKLREIPPCSPRRPTEEEGAPRKTERKEQAGGPKTIRNRNQRSNQT